VNWGYRLAWFVTWPFLTLVYPRLTFGREHVPGPGAFLICDNHSSAIDPFLIAYSMGWRCQIHYMAKAELFRVPLIGFILRAIGMFPVDRQGGGAMAIKGAMRLLKDGEKVGMFPEGTRIQTEEESEAKTGAVRLAARLGVPIVPVYLPRRKKILRFNRIAIGAPYLVELDKKAAPEDVERAAEELMAKIRQLGGADE